MVANTIESVSFSIWAYRFSASDKDLEAYATGYHIVPCP